MPMNIFNKCSPIKYHSDGTYYLEIIRDLGHPIFLDSNAGHTSGRFDIITSQPISIILCSQNKEITDHYKSKYINSKIFNLESSDQDIFFTIENEINKYTTKNFKYKNLPFCSGAIGLFSYDFGLKIHGRLKELTKDWPVLHVGIYQWSIIQDHDSKESWLVSDPKLDDDIFRNIKERLSSEKDTFETKPFKLSSTWSGFSNFEKYKKAFQRAKEYIISGHCYQINLAQEFKNFFTGDPLDAYKSLRQSSPTPFAAYIETPHGCVLSLSPERFIKIKKGIVTTTPIKGTCKRGANPEEDSILKNKLSISMKNKAENLMIVDLMRNDISKDCKIGTIKTPELFYIESYKNVHHMVSKITGEIKSYNVKSTLELLKNCIPGGSITGAPKKRSIEIINELEDFDRSIYCGAIATISNQGELDSNILIRSFLLTFKENKDGEIICWGGGGIVSDSEVESEYNECFQKINNIIEALD